MVWLQLASQRAPPAEGLGHLCRGSLAGLSATGSAAHRSEAEPETRPWHPLIPPKLSVSVHSSVKQEGGSSHPGCRVPSSELVVSLT